MIKSRLSAVAASYVSVATKTESVAKLCGDDKQLWVGATAVWCVNLALYQRQQLVKVSFSVGEIVNITLETGHAA